MMIMNYMKSALEIYHNKGITRLCRIIMFHLYRTIFLSPYELYIVPFLPRRSGKYNGVDTNSSRLFDGFVPGRKRDRPEYESGLVSAMENKLKEGDDVVIVGGGWGVTAVLASNMVGECGNITVFEGAKESVEKIEETVRMNDTYDNIKVNHCVVGEAVSLRGELGDAQRLKPADLPNCDVLELDCEGSEIEILRNMDFRPRIILIESHGIHNAPSTEVAEILRENSYSILSKNVADNDLQYFCERNDIYVYTALNEL